MTRMNLKFEYIALAVIIIGLSLYLVFRGSDRTNYTLPRLPAVAADSITRLELTHAGQTVRLVRDAGQWHIDPQGWRADPAKVKAMVDTLSRLTFTVLASEAGDYGRYDLDPSHRVDVKAYAGKELVRHIEVGKTAPSYRHTFVKLADNPRVFHARNNFRTTFDQTAAQLRDKQVLDFDPATVNGIEIRTADQIVRLSRHLSPVDVSTTENRPPAKAPGGGAVSGWIDAAGVKLDDTKVMHWLDSLAKLQCKAYVDGKTAADYETPVYRVILNGPTEHRLAIYAEPGNGEKDVPAVASGSKSPFLLAGWTARELMKTGEDFRSTKPSAQPKTR